MTKSAKEKKDIEAAGKAADLLTDLQAKAEKIEQLENAPLKLFFGAAFDIEYQIPMVKRISPKLIDSIAPILSKYKTSTVKEFQMQMVSNGLIDRDAYDKSEKEKTDAQNDLQGSNDTKIEYKDSDTLHNEYMTLWLTEARKLLADDGSEFNKTAIYNLSEFELMLKGSDYPQKREDYDRDVRILQMIIDKSAINTGVKFLQLKNIAPVPDILSDASSDFWQSQDAKEVSRVVGKFRKDNGI